MSDAVKWTIFCPGDEQLLRSGIDPAAIREGLSGMGHLMDCAHCGNLVIIEAVNVAAKCALTGEFEGDADAVEKTISALASKIRKAASKNRAQVHTALAGGSA